MKRSYIVFALTPMLAALTIAAASCSAGKSKGSAAKPVSTYDPNSEEGDAGGVSASHQTLDASPLSVDGAFSPIRRVDSPAQALQVLISAYDAQRQEGELGKTEGSTPPMKAFANDVVEEAKTGKARIRQVAANKHITPASSMLNDQVKFESQASISHLQNIFQNMFNSSWCTRQAEAASALIRTIDSDLAPVMEDDEDLKEAVATTRAEAEKRMARADAVKQGLNNPGSANGMFPEPEDPEPQPQPQAQDPAPPADAAAAK